MNSTRSCTLIQCSHLRIWTELEDLGGWEVQQQHEQEHSGCVEGDLTAIQEDNSTWNCSGQVWSEQKMCQWCKTASRIKIINRADATKITNMVETCTRDRRDLTRGSKDKNHK